MPLNRPIHIPSPPCVTCTLHMCEKIPSPPNVIPCFAPFVRKDLKLSAAGRLTHGAQTCYKEAEIVDQAYSLMHPIWAGNKVMPFTLHKAPTLICNSWSWWSSCDSLRVFQKFLKEFLIWKIWLQWSRKQCSIQRSSQIRTCRNSKALLENFVLLAVFEGLQFPKTSGVQTQAWKNLRKKATKSDLNGYWLGLRSVKECLYRANFVFVLFIMTYKVYSCLHLFLWT